MSERHRVKCAVYLILRDGDKVLLSMRHNTGWKDGWFSLVAGHVEAGEAAEQSVIREAKEEAGITIHPNDLRHVFTAHRLSDDTTDDYVDLFFECTRWSGDIENAEPEKCTELRWVAIDELPEKLLDYISLVLQAYPTGKMYSSIER